MVNKLTASVISIFTFLITINNCAAQSKSNNWQFGFNGGVFVYQGQLSPSVLGSYKTLKPTISLYFARILTPSFSLRTNLAFGALKGDESKYSEPAYRKQRNLAFHTPITEVSELLVWNIFGNSGNEIGNRFSPYVFGGAGLTFINVTRSSNINKSFFVNEPEVITNVAADFKVAPPKAIVVVPVGFGVDYFLSNKVSLTLETSFRYTQTDYLDGFSRISTAKVHDYYQSHTIGLVFKFGKDNKLGCPVLKY